MIAQYTQAAIVSELKRLAAPASRRLDPVLGDAGGPRLDGLVGGAQAATAVDGLARVLAVEVLTAARGIHLRAPLAPAPASAAVVDALVTAGAGRPGADRWLSPEIDTAYGLVNDGTVRRAAESRDRPPHLTPPPLTTQADRRIFTTKSTSALSRESPSPLSRRSRVHLVWGMDTPGP